MRLFLVGVFAFGRPSDCIVVVMACVVCAFIGCVMERCTTALVLAV